MENTLKGWGHLVITWSSSKACLSYNSAQKRWKSSVSVAEESEEDNYKLDDEDPNNESEASGSVNISLNSSVPEINVSLDSSSVTENDENIKIKRTKLGLQRKRFQRNCRVGNCRLGGQVSGGQVSGGQVSCWASVALSKCR